MSARLLAAMVIAAAWLCPAAVSADIAPPPDSKGSAKDTPTTEKHKVKVESRAVVAHEEVVVCLHDGEMKSGDGCPTGRASVIGVVPVEEGALRLPHAIATIRTMSEAHPDDPCGENRIAEGVGWEHRDLGRALTVLPPTNATYQKAVAEKVGIAEVKLTGLVRVDLEGDGVDEVLFTTDSHGGERPWGDEPYKTYSHIGVRKVGADGQVVTHLLHDHQGEVRWEGGFPDITTAQLEGFTDADGDGKLEVVITIRGYESYTTFVYRVTADKAESLGLSGCAI